MKNYAFTLEMEVRDYECDLQGIVNNSVYQNYLEHARHKYLTHLGLDFAAFTRRKINLLVVRAELDYKFPLSSGDEFYVGVNLARESRIKFAFLQDIFRLSDDKLILKARIIGTALTPGGRPHLPEEFANILTPGRL